MNTLSNIRALHKSPVTGIRENARVIDYSRPATGKVISVSDCQSIVLVRWHNGRKAEYSSRALAKEGTSYRFGASSNGL
ncbi:MAG: hypothetical protein ACRBBW_03955 [Cellvibrionaceae bacterium]